MNEHPSVKIFCVDHNKDGVINPQGHTTIRVGRGTIDSLDVLCDDRGENIASLNPHINEATGLWWIWKHKECREGIDYIGLCHYRRFLIFKQLQDTFKTYSSRTHVIYLKLSCYKNLSKLCCSSIDAKRFFVNHTCDGLLPLSRWIPEGVRQNFINMKHVTPKWFDRTIEILKEKNPEFGNYYEKEVTQGTRFYVCENFVVKTGLFESMCEVVMPIVLQLASEWMVNPREKSYDREIGYITETLIGTYWKWLEDTKKAKFKYCLHVAFMSNGHSMWYVWFCKLVYKFFPDSVAYYLMKLHEKFVHIGLMPSPRK